MDTQGSQFQGEYSGSKNERSHFTSEPSKGESSKSLDQTAKAVSENSIPLFLKVKTSFSNELMKEFVKSHFTNPKTKITDDAVNMLSQIAKLMAVEAAARAGRQATLENRNTITLDDVEHILPQLMLDLP